MQVSSGGLGVPAPRGRSADCWRTVPDGKDAEGTGLPERAASAGTGAMSAEARVTETCLSHCHFAQCRLAGAVGTSRLPASSLLPRLGFSYGVKPVGRSLHRAAWGEGRAEAAGSQAPPSHRPVSVCHPRWLQTKRGAPEREAGAGPRREQRPCAAPVGPHGPARPRPPCSWLSVCTGDASHTGCENYLGNTQTE